MVDIDDRAEGGECAEILAYGRIAHSQRNKHNQRPLTMPHIMHLPPRHPPNIPQPCRQIIPRQFIKRELPIIPHIRRQYMITISIPPTIPQPNIVTFIGKNESR